MSRPAPKRTPSMASLSSLSSLDSDADSDAYPSSGQASNSATPEIGDGRRPSKRARREASSAGASTLRRITVAGQKLEPTEVFDTFWRWLHERQAIDEKRRAGDAAPWTADPILQTNRFCQAYRVLDKGSQFLIREVIEKGSQKEEDMLFRILLYNTFNRNETYELFQRELGDLTWASFDLARYDAVLLKAESDARGRGEGFTAFTGAYQKVAPKFRGKSNTVRYLLLLEEMMEVLPPVLRSAKYAADIFEEIASLPGMGDFLAFQLYLCLSYSPLFHFSPDDFVVPGIGCSSGLFKMFGSSLREAKLTVRDIESQILRWLVDNQRAQFKRLGLEFAFLRDASGAEIKLQLPDMEHAACEVDKYARFKHRDIPGTSNKTATRGKFSAPEARRLPEKPVLPLAWAHPKRRVARIRKDPIVVNKAYSPVRIVRQRKAEGRADGETVEYEIEWWGYAATSWEPRYQFLEDAPTMVAAWEAARSKKGKSSR